MTSVKWTVWFFATLISPSSLAAPCVEKDARTRIPAIALEKVASGFTHPVHVAHAGDGSGRLFVVEQAGLVRVVENGKILSTPFLDIRDRVESGGEKGMLGIAFHPRHKENGFFFINYTTRAGKLYTHVSRFRRASANAADPKSETQLLKIHQPYSNHNGGQLAFGPDGYLYVGMGDGGSANDPHGYGQATDTLLGKMLRIDVNRQQPPLPYAIPTDNPFVGKKNYREEIWALGLRNPWRFSFDRANGRLYAADVGQDAVEEIDVIEKGGNYGWSVMEGDVCTPTVNKNCNARGYQMPIHVYRHPDGFSVTGGFVYRGEKYPALCGVYLFADYASKRMWGLRYDGSQVVQSRELIGRNPADKVLDTLGGQAPNVSSFGEDEAGELYVADYPHGKIYRVTVP
jgi:glucose/arabinose dehydrogenase